MQKYADSKMRILQNQKEEDAFIYWADDPIIKKELEKFGIKAQNCPFSILRKCGMIGYIEDGTYHIETPTPFNMEQESLSLHGKHNMYNSLAAGIATRLAGVNDEELKLSLSNFEGVEHRLEKVATIGGVTYVNDSKATNVDACWYALESMTSPTILIIGGKDKGNDYEPIKKLVKEKCVGLVFLGIDNSKLHKNFDDLEIDIVDTNNMNDCVQACKKLARPGYSVLLSPCCASFDLFKNMEDRGEQFKKLVRNL
jgi:UDP-N-acetylmuramoylalanine--D-glutamate ligase